MHTPPARLSDVDVPGPVADERRGAFRAAPLLPVVQRLYHHPSEPAAALPYYLTAHPSAETPAMPSPPDAMKPDMASAAASAAGTITGLKSTRSGAASASPARVAARASPEMRSSAAPSGTRSAAVAKVDACRLLARSVDFRSRPCIRRSGSYRSPWGCGGGWWWPPCARADVVAMASREAWREARAR
jgi:hypothetical protein